jgi:hypothetical protein
LLATGVLFQKNKKDRLVRQARILQDILKYSLMIDENKQFNQKELSDWLADNTNSFDFERNTPRKYRRDKVSKEIGSLLEPLVKLGLIRQTWPVIESNANKELILLQYTKAGLLLALIIDSFDLEHRLEDNRKIYEILQTYHSTNKSSKHQFFLNLLKIYHQQDNLDDMTENIRKALEKVDYIPITDLMDIYEIVTVRYFTDLEKAKVFVSNSKSALSNLESSIRGIFLYNIKLEVEAEMGDCKDLGDPILYENYRFELRGNPEETALQARCIICDIVQNLSYKTSNLINLMIRRLNDKPLTLTIKCPSCNTFDCLVIPCL